MSLPVVGSSGLLVSLLFGFHCSGAEVPRVTLTVHQGMPADLAVGMYQLPIKCDSGGNLYARPFQDPGPDKPLRPPILKIGRDGKLSASFSFEHVGDIDTKDLELIDFSAGRLGEVYALVASKKASYVVAFRSNAEFQSATLLSLDPSFQASRFVRLSSGQYLLTGLKGTKRDPTILLLDTAGNIVRTFNTKETYHTDPAGAATKGDIDSFELSDLQVGEDGNIYIMRPSAPAKILVLSVLGEVVREFAVEAPGSDYFPLSLALGGGRIVVIFEQRKAPGQSIARYVYRVIDANTWTPLLDYVTPPELWGAFACYVPPAQFSVLMPQEDGRFRLENASAP
jgi:hypothetical protein